MGIRLTREEAWEELAGAHTGVFTSLRADGVPISLPVWFVALDERIYLSGPAHTKKFARVRHDPRVSFLVESGERWSELRAVHLTGTATIVADPAVTERVLAALDVKYRAYRTQRSAMPAETRSRYSTGATVVEIVPDDRILSWDNARIPLSPE